MNNEEPKLMGTAEILSHASELASQEPNDWFRHFERYDAELMRWCQCQSQQHLFRSMASGRGIRLAPQTMDVIIQGLPIYQMAMVATDRLDPRRVHITLTYRDKATASQAVDILTNAFSRRSNEHP